MISTTSTSVGQVLGYARVLTGTQDEHEGGIDGEDVWR